MEDFNEEELKKILPPSELFFFKKAVERASPRKTKARC